MARRGIRLFGDPVLRRRSAPVIATEPSTRALIEDLFDTMREAQGVGLAANQIGVPARVCVVDCSSVVPGGIKRALCNPELIRAGEPLSGEEGCLSFPGLYVQVRRSEEAHLRYETTEGRTEEIKATGLEARVLLHELDHLDGVLFVDGLGAARRVLLGSRLRQLKRRQKQGELV